MIYSILRFQTTSEQQELKCWFFKDKPWLYLRGIGVERLHTAPEVLYFRNVLTDSEIEVVKKLGRPKVRAWGVFSQKCVVKFVMVVDVEVESGLCFGWLDRQKDGFNFK